MQTGLTDADLIRCLKGRILNTLRKHASSTSLNKIAYELSCFLVEEKMVTMTTMFDSLGIEDDGKGEDYPANDGGML